jgi:hypothetical protein
MLGGGIRAKAPEWIAPEALLRAEPMLPEIRAQLGRTQKNARHKGLHHLGPPPTILELRRTAARAATRPAPAHCYAPPSVRKRGGGLPSRKGAAYVIESLTEGPLPCAREEIRFFDRKSAVTFLEIFERLGHPYLGFLIRERM